jgi:hypothetical protein
MLMTFPTIVELSKGNPMGQSDNRSGRIASNDDEGKKKGGENVMTDKEAFQRPSHSGQASPRIDETGRAGSASGESKSNK